MQALALILAPLPHEREQWDHSPHPCHWLLIFGLSSNPIHSSSRQSLISEGSPEQDPRLPLQARALILEPLPQEVEHLDHSSHCWYWLVITGLVLEPGHASTRQSVVSVGSPEQDPSPLLQARALIFNPLPHELEHWDHSLHPCHSFSAMHFSKRQSLVSVHFPDEQDPSLPLQARALILDPLPQVVEQWDQGLHSCHVEQGCFT